MCSCVEKTSLIHSIELFILFFATDKFVYDLKTRNSARPIANRSRVSCAHNTSRTFIVTPQP